MSNGIGQFVIGVSPIGDEPFDWRRTIYSQYANSPVLLALVEYVSNWLDPTEAIDFFFDNLWNVDTAVGYGLDVWGRIVGVNRVLPVSSKYLGFQEAGTISADPFNNSPLYSHASSENFALSDPAYRQLILAKAAANIWDGSIPGLNAILRMLLPGNVCYVTSGGDQTMQYVFNFVLSPVQRSIIFLSGVLPRPAGVSATFVEI